MKIMKFKVKEIACAICNKKFPTNTYKNKFPFPKSVPANHLPEHKCEEDE
jgi:hypothetical protein